MESGSISYEDFARELEQVDSIIPLANLSLRLAVPRDQEMPNAAARLAMRAMQELTRNGGGYEEHGLITEGPSVKGRLLKALHHA